MSGDPKKLPCELCGRAAPPAPGSEQHPKSCTFECGYPLPHLDELVPERALQRFVEERLDLRPGYQPRQELSRRVAEVVKETRELRAERSRLARLVESMEQAGAPWPGGVPPGEVKLVTIIFDFVERDRLAFAMRPGAHGVDLDCTKGKPDPAFLLGPNIRVGTIKLRVAGEWVPQ